MALLLRLLATFGFAALVLLTNPGPTRADELNDAYRVRIVVSIKKHPLLTDIFREQVKRELRDGLKSALGDLARVTVSDKHPRLADIQARGLGRALDGVRERGPERTYFVCIDFDGTHYKIETRMLDGLTGLPSPVVRQASIRDTDRAYVSRRATFMLERDLGLLGTVVGEPDRQGMVPVEMRGGALGVDLGKWVKKGEVFALVKVDGNGPGTQVPWTILRVVEPPSKGVCRCQLFSRYDLRQVTGLRAVLLGTTTGPLRLRILQEKGVPVALVPLQSAVTVQIRRDGFASEDTSRLQMMASRGRDVDTSRMKKPPFDKIAFVSVVISPTQTIRLPVPILEDRLVVAGVPQGNESDDLATFRFRMLVRRVLDAAQVQSDMFRDINKLIGQADQRKAAIERVKQTLERSRKDHSELTAERDEVRKELAKLPPKSRPTLTGVNDRLKLLKSGEADLVKTVAALEKIEKEENDPEKKDWLLQKEKAGLLETEGEVKQAIEIYEKAPEKFQTEELKAHLAELKKLWTPVSKEHEAARKFIIDTYPTLSTEQLSQQIGEARKALQVCEKANDLIGPLRLRKATLEHVKRIDEEAGKLNPSVNIDDEKPLKTIQELVPELRKLVEEIGTYLDRKKKETTASPAPAASPPRPRPRE